MSRMSDVQCDVEAAPFVTFTVNREAVEIPSPGPSRQYAPAKLVSLTFTGMVDSEWPAFRELEELVVRLKKRCEDANSSQDT